MLTMVYRSKERELLRWEALWCLTDVSKGQKLLSAPTRTSGRNSKASGR